MCQEKISEEDCGSELDVKVELECELMANKDLKITPVGKENLPEVLIGVNNVHKEYK